MVEYMYDATQESPEPRRRGCPHASEAESVCEACYHADMDASEPRPILPRDCDGGMVDLAAEAREDDMINTCKECSAEYDSTECPNCFHPDQRIGLVDDSRPGAYALMAEADKMADDADWHARHCTTWRERWQWWTAKQSALSLAWRLSFINGTPREQSTYTSLSDETPWGITIDKCWRNWLAESRGENVPL